MTDWTFDAVCSAAHCTSRPIARLARKGDEPLAFVCGYHYRQWTVRESGAPSGNYRRLLLKSGRRLVPNLLPYHGHGGVHLEGEPNPAMPQPVPGQTFALLIGGLIEELQGILKRYEVADC